MQVVILAGGLGTRLSEETTVRPKPMVEIGDRPILWHIMKSYSHYGFGDFFIALGYKGEMIKHYFADYYMSNSSMSVSLAQGKVAFLDGEHEDWKVHLIDTGTATNTGGRLHRLQKYLKPETFMLTYGDGVCDLDLNRLLEFHRAHGKLATITAVRPPARFGGLVLDGDQVAQFEEKSQIREGWINGGFMVFEPGIFDYLEGDRTVLEADTLECVARSGELYAFRHESFWQCMDTLREKRYLEDLWQSGKAPWKTW